MKNITVSDVSLILLSYEREQAPLSYRKKLVRAVCDLKVDSIELPALTSFGEDQKIVTGMLAEEAGDVQVRIPLGDDERQVSATLEAVKDVKDLCLQVAYPVSTVQLEYKHHQKAAAALMVIEGRIDVALSHCNKVELILQDATRADREFLSQICDMANSKGVCEITLQDNSKAALPREIADLISFVKARFHGRINLITTNRLGMGISCALAAIEAGCDGLKTSCVLQGALPLADFARLLHVRGESLGFGGKIDVTLAEQTIADLNRVEKVPMLSQEDSGAFTRLTEECSIAEVADASSALGYDLSEEDCGKVHDEVVRVAAKKGSIGKREFEAIIAGSAMTVPSTYHVKTYVINSGNVISSTAQLVLVKDGEDLRGVSVGDGPIDAAFQTIEQIIGHHYELEDFQISAVTRGREALGSALVKLRSGGVLYSGNGVSTDIVGAAIRAYVNALNKIVYEEA